MREKILDVAQELIQRRGINGMSYSDISKAVEIKKASIHHHFATKNDLIKAVLERYCERFAVERDEILSSPLKPRTKLQRFMSLFEETLAGGNKDRTCLCGMLSAELLSLNEESATLVQLFLENCRMAISQILKEGAEDGSFNLSGSTKNVADLFLATLEGGLFMSRLEGGTERFSKIVRQLEKTLL